MKIEKFLFMSVLFTIIASLSALAQNNEKPCSYPEAKQFDFWVGTWKAEWTDKNGNESEGTNTIKKILGGCVVEENFDGNPGTPLIGKSMSVYVPRLKKWKQTWVDNSGGYLDFTGEFEMGKMILSRDFLNKDGKKISQRMVYYNINKESFDWNWERSMDDGKTWKVMWKIHYTRKS